MARSDAKEWRDSMVAELIALDEKDSWFLVDLPLGKRVIGTKWVFRIKTDGHNVFDRYKSRLVPLGYLQEFGIDFDEAVGQNSAIITAITPV